MNYPIHYFHGEKSKLDCKEQVAPNEVLSSVTEALLSCIMNTRRDDESTFVIQLLGFMSLVQSHGSCDLLVQIP